MLAAYEGHEARLRLLIVAGVDADAKSARGRTAAMYAASWGASPACRC